MAYDPKVDPFHQEVSFQVIPSKRLNAGELNAAMKSVGMDLYYDVYAMPRDGEVAEWQSETYANVDLYLGGKSADAQEGCDLIVVSYPLATIDSSYISRFGELIVAVSGAVCGRIEYDGKPMGRDAVIDVLTQCATDVMENWGEEPGSKELRVLIETSG